MGGTDEIVNTWKWTSETPTRPAFDVSWVSPCRADIWCTTFCTTMVQWSTYHNSSFNVGKSRERLIRASPWSPSIKLRKMFLQLKITLWLQIIALLRRTMVNFRVSTILALYFLIIGRTSKIYFDQIWRNFCSILIKSSVIFWGCIKYF